MRLIGFFSVLLVTAALAQAAPVPSALDEITTQLLVRGAARYDLVDGGHYLKSIPANPDPQCPTEVELQYAKTGFPSDVWIVSRDTEGRVLAITPLVPFRSGSQDAGPPGDLMVSKWAGESLRLTFSPLGWMVVRRRAVPQGDWVVVAFTLQGEWVDTSANGSYYEYDVSVWLEEPQSPLGSITR